MNLYAMVLAGDERLVTMEFIRLKLSSQYNRTVIEFDINVIFTADKNAYVANDIHNKFLRSNLSKTLFV